MSIKDFYFLEKKFFILNSYLTFLIKSSCLKVLYSIKIRVFWVCLFYFDSNGKKSVLKQIWSLHSLKNKYKIMKRVQRWPYWVTRWFSSVFGDRIWKEKEMMIPIYSLDNPKYSLILFSLNVLRARLSGGSRHHSTPTPPESDAAEQKTISQMKRERERDYDEWSQK